MKTQLMIKWTEWIRHILHVSCDKKWSKNNRTMHELSNWNHNIIARRRFDSLFSIFIRSSRTSVPSAVQTAIGDEVKTWISIQKIDKSCDTLMQTFDSFHCNQLCECYYQHAISSTNRKFFSTHFHCLILRFSCDLINK